MYVCMCIYTYIYIYIYIQALKHEEVEQARQKHSAAERLMKEAAI